MHFSVAVPIARPIEQVWETFVDPTRLREWQATLQHIEPLTGPPGAIGSVARFTYREGGRDVVMTETITERQPPTLFAQRLEASMMHSTMRNRFASTPDGGTTWTLECDISFRGPWKLLGLFGRRMMVRKTEHDMRLFKALVER